MLGAHRSGHRQSGRAPGCVAGCRRARRPHRPRRRGRHRCPRRQPGCGRCARRGHRRSAYHAVGLRLRDGRVARPRCRLRMQDVPQPDGRLDRWGGRPRGCEPSPHGPNVCLRAARGKGFSLVRRGRVSLRSAGIWHQWCRGVQRRCPGVFDGAAGGSRRWAHRLAFEHAFQRGERFRRPGHLRLQGRTWRRHRHRRGGLEHHYAAPRAAHRRCGHHCHRSPGVGPGDNNTPHAATRGRHRSRGGVSGSGLVSPTLVARGVCTCARSPWSSRNHRHRLR
jgi:hypothetical protein